MTDGWTDHAVAVAGCTPVDPRRMVAPARPLQPDESLEQLLARVGRSLGVDWDELKGASRIRHIATARKIAYAEGLAAGYSSVAIGKALGGRNHSTVLAGAKSLHKLHDQGGDAGG